MDAQAWIAVVIAALFGVFVLRKMLRQFRGKEQAVCDKCSDTTAHKH